jgi:hypothetical protein
MLWELKKEDARYPKLLKLAEQNFWLGRSRRLPAILKVSPTEESL